MKCSACGCPGAYALLCGLLCWNRQCRNWDSAIVSGSDFSQEDLVNGDSKEELEAFLDDVDDESKYEQPMGFPNLRLN